MTALTFNQRVQDSSSCGRTKNRLKPQGFKRFFALYNSKDEICISV